jgi:RecA/RadA recombinase
LDVFSDPVASVHKVDALRSAVGRIQARWGTGSLESATTRIQRDATEQAPLAYATGIRELDALLPGGGFPAGRVSLCLGRVGSGKMQVGYHFLAETSHLAAAVLLLDLRGHADPWLLAGMGARLDRLLILRPGAGMELVACLEAALALVRSGAGCLVVDLPPRHAASPAWDSFAPVLAGACNRDGIPFLVLGEGTGEALRYASSLTVRVQRTEWVLRHGDVSGIRVRAAVEKSKLGASGGTAEFTLQLPLGIFMPPLMAGVEAEAGEDARELRVLAS